VQKGAFSGLIPGQTRHSPMGSTQRCRPAFHLLPMTTKSPMYIGYVTLQDLTWQAASNVQMIQMCRAFTRLGHRVELHGPGGQDVSSPKRLARIQDLYGDDLPFPIHFFRSGTVLGRLQMLGGLPGALQAMRRAQPRVICCRGNWEVLPLARMSHPVIFEAHSVRLHNEFSLVDRILRRRIVQASRLPGLRLFVPISRALSQVWQKFGVPEKKIHVAHDGVDLSLFEPALTTDEARATLGLQENRPVILYAGSLYEDRGLELLLGAAKALPDYRFWVIGGRDEDVTRCREAAQRGRVTNVDFHGFIPHPRVPVYLFAADVLLMLWTWKVPTIATCSPMKMFEYMAAERTIVGPAFPTVLEVLQDGREAILFEPDNLHEMITALKRGVEEAHHGSMAQAARRKVAAEYTWEHRCKGILEAFAAQGPEEPPRQVDNSEKQ
jgi:glycosyltransferase involved in cell wall biosynthesis